MAIERMTRELVQWLSGETFDEKYEALPPTGPGDVSWVGGLSTIDNIVTFDDTTGKTIKDSTVPITAIGLNTTHRTSDGKSHADVVLNNAHRADVLTNPHNVTASQVGAIGEAPIDGALYARLNGAWQGVNDWLGGSETEKVEGIQFDLAVTPAHSEGLLHWDDDAGTLELGMPGGNVKLQIGQEMHYRVVNKTGSLIANGSPVYTDGAQGGRATIALSSADFATGNGRVIGVTTEDIANNANGYITTLGIVGGVDTSAWAEGVPLWLSTTAGELTNIPPSAPDHRAVVAGVITSNATEGKIYVQGISSMQLDSLSDVASTAPDTTNKHLIWDDANDYWEAGQVHHHDLDGLLDTDDHPQYVEKNGWDIDYRDYVTLSFVDGTRTFSIAPTGASFHYWSNGVQYTKTTTQSVVIDDAEGIWFIKFTDGTLVASQTVWDIATDNDALTAVVYWNATDNQSIGVGYELHSWAMDPATHAYKHHTTGSLYSEGFLPGDLDIDGSGNDASAAQMSMSNGVFYDEDIPLVCADGLPQEMAPILQAPVMYRNGANGDWRKVAATDYPIHPTGTGRPAYNEWTGATWQVTEVGNNNYCLIHILATNNLDDPMRSVMGQNEYTTIGNAREGANTEMANLQLGALALMTPEFIPICSFIVQASSIYTNAVKGRFRSTDTGDDFIDWRGITASGSGSGGGLTSDHGELAGLGDDDHPQYHNDTRGDLRYSQLGHGHVAADISDFDTEVENNTEVAANSAHRVVVTGNPHAVTKTDVGLSAVLNNAQVRNMASSFSTDFILTSAPVGTNKLLTESAAGSMRYTTMADLPISDDTQTAIDAAAGGSNVKRRMFYIENVVINEMYPICMVPVACTITEVTAQTSANICTFNLEERAKGTPGTVGTSVFSSAQLAYATMQTLTTFSNSGLAAETWLYFRCYSTTTPPKTWITVEYEED